MLSPGGWGICALAVVSAIVFVVLWPISPKEGLMFWLFAKSHQRLYDPMTLSWNTAQLPAQIVAQAFKGPLEEVGIAI